MRNTSRVAMIVAAAFALGTAPVTAQVGENLGLVNPNLASAQELGAVPGLTSQSVSAIEAGQFGAIAVTVVQWSSLTSQAMSVPWTVVHDTASAHDFAALIAGMERTSEEGGTSISAMIKVGVILFDVNRFEGTRKVIDISADGPNNNGPKIAPMRALANNKGVTVNGLVILHEDKTLDYYFRNRVITGDDAFVVKASGYENYVEAILQKLVREIGNPATS